MNTGDTGIVATTATKLIDKFQALRKRKVGIKVYVTYRKGKEKGICRIAYLSTDKSAQGKCGELPGVDAIFIDMAHVQLNGGNILGSYQPVGRRTARTNRMSDQYFSQHQLWG